MPDTDDGDEVSGAARKDERAEHHEHPIEIQARVAADEHHQRQRDREVRQGDQCIGADFGRHEHGIPCRSEEHTSELQSLMRISYAVFCLKKKKTIQITETIINQTTT